MNLNRINLILVYIGVALRFRHFMENRSLWTEEAKYAISILGRSFREIFYYVQTLPDQQLNSLGFYLVEKLFVAWLGPTEMALRMYPFICSIISIFLFYFLAKYFLKPMAVTLALALFVLSEPLIYFAAEVKPYSSDVMVGLLLILTFEYAKRREFNSKSMLILSVVGASVIWFSNTSLFILAAVALCLTDQIISFRFYNRIPSLIGVVSVWLTSFLSLYLVSLSHLIQSHYIWSGINGKFSSDPFWSINMMDWIAQVFLMMYENPIGIEFTLVASVLFLTGVQAFARQDADRFGLLILPVLIVFLMGCFKLYPVFGSDIVFLIPIVYLFLAAGLIWVKDNFKRVGFIISVLISIFIFYYPVIHVYGFVTKGFGFQDNRQMMSYFNKHYQPGDVVCINGKGLYPFGYYFNPGNRNKLLNTSPVFEVSDRALPLGASQILPVKKIRPIFTDEGVYRHVHHQNGFSIGAAELRRFISHDRVWLLVSNPAWPSEKLMMDYFNRVGRLMIGHQFKEAAVYLYDFKQSKRYDTLTGRPIVFIGDSFIAKNDWVSFFNNNSLINLGVIGDKTQDVYNRLDGVIYLNAEKIFLMVGINDNLNQLEMGQALRTYDRILSKLKMKSPGSQIYIQSVLPINYEKYSRYYSRKIHNGDIKLFNRYLKKLADKYQANYIDLYSVYDDNGQLNTELTEDGLHLNRDGYRRWKPFFNKYIQSNQ